MTSGHEYRGDSAIQCSALQTELFANEYMKDHIFELRRNKLIIDCKKILKFRQVNKMLYLACTKRH